MLPFLTLTHPLTVTILLLWCRLWLQTPMVSLFLSCVYIPSASTPLLLHIPPSGSMIEIVLIKYSGNCIIGNVICSDRILTCRINSICSPAKVGLVVTDLITSPVVSWRGWETPPQHCGSAVILCSTTVE